MKRDIPHVLHINQSNVWSYSLFLIFIFDFSDIAYQPFSRLTEPCSWLCHCGRAVRYHLDLALPRRKHHSLASGGVDSWQITAGSLLLQMIPSLQLKIAASPTAVPSAPGEQALHKSPRPSSGQYAGPQGSAEALVVSVALPPTVAQPLPLPCLALHTPLQCGAFGCSPIKSLHGNHLSLVPGSPGLQQSPFLHCAVCVCEIVYICSMPESYQDLWQHSPSPSCL